MRDSGKKTSLTDMEFSTIKIHLTSQHLLTGTTSKKFHRSGLNTKETFAQI